MLALICVFLKGGSIPAEGHLCAIRNSSQLRNDPYERQHCIVVLVLDLGAILTWHCAGAALLLQTSAVVNVPVQVQGRTKGMPEAEWGGA